MSNEYKEMVRQAWKYIGIAPYDTRGFVQTVKDLVDSKAELESKLMEKENTNDWN